MNAAAENFSAVARERFLAREGRPLLIGDWTRALFVHFEIPAECLQPHIPFELDLWNGVAYVSLVAFNMERLRLNFGGVLGRLLFWPISHHRFLNLRTYVVHNGRSAIYFISEWLNNPVCVLGGPVAYGLPYRYARINYAHDPGCQTLEGNVGGAFKYCGEISAASEFRECASGSLDEFLIERYTAFTRIGGFARYFDIWHDPWKQVSASICIQDDRLIRTAFPWFSEARLASANYSTGVRNVWMGAPHRAARAEIGRAHV